MKLLVLDDHHWCMYGVLVLVTSLAGKRWVM